MTVKEMQAGLRGGLSLEGRRYLLLERDVDICDWFEFTHDGGRSLHISRRPELIQVFFLSFGAYLMGKRRCTLARDSKAELVNDARLDGFPATHLEPYSQAADVGKHRRGEPSKPQALTLIEFQEGAFSVQMGCSVFENAPLFIAFISR